MTEEKHRWILVYTKPNQESKAKENLKNQYFETFLPFLAIKNKFNDFITKPLFPRYIFVRLNFSNSKWHTISSTKGISHVITFADKPAVIEDNIINSIRLKLDKNNIYYLVNKKIKYQKGDSVTIGKGKLQGIEAIFLSNTPKNRVKVLLKFLNTNIVANLPKSALKSKDLNQTIKI